MKISKSFSSHSGRETAKFGSALTKIILKKSTVKSRGAVVLALHGDLGAGKTTFTQGFAKALGIKRRLISPTFVIMRRYNIPAGKNRGRSTQFKNLYHLDAYRLKKPDALEMLGFKKILADRTAIILIEWPENVKKLLPKNSIWLKFRHGKKENERVIISR